MAKTRTAKAMTLRELFEAYRVRKLMGAADATVRKYDRVIKQAEKLIGRAATVDDLTDELVARMMASKIEKGRSAHTANGDRAKLCALWTWGAKKGYVSTFPDVDALRAPETIPTAWTAEQLPQVFAACDKATRDMCGVPGALWFRALLSVLWDSGERVGAILDATYSRLNGEWLTIPAAARKGKTRDKLYRLHPETLSLLHRMRAYHQRDDVFPHDCCREQVLNRFRTMLKRAGLPYDRKHLFHCIRRSVASHAKAAGGDATAILDHADGAITRKFYIDPRVAPTVAPVDILFRPSQLPEGGAIHA